MTIRKKRYTPKGFISGISKRKTSKSRLKFALFFIVGALVTALYNGIPTGAQVEQYIAENVMLNDIKISDGDTLRIKGQSFRLLGIDAPESKQTCSTLNGDKWPCGLVARSALWKMTNGKQVTCDVTNKDKYSRNVAICYVGNTELNREMVKQGMAVAYTQYSKRYVNEEKEAQAAKIGIWQGQFIEPRQWRKSH